MTASLRLLGGFELSREDGTPVEIGVRKAKALLIYLALNAGRELSRDRLAGMLWEQSNQQRARHSLRQALADLRRVLPEEMAAALHGEGETLKLERGACGVDVRRFEALLDAGSEADLEAAVALYAGDLAEGFDPRSASFEDWLLQRQSGLRERALDAMQKLLDGRGADGGEAAVRLGLRILALDPLRESVHRALMRLYASLGRHGAALKQYRVCRAHLQRELGVASEPATDALYRRILAQRDGKAGADTPPTASPVREAGTPQADVAAAPCGTPADAPADAGIELRFASVLAVRLDDGAATPNAEQLHRRLNNFASTAREHIERYGGRVASQLGEILIGVFGTPGTQGNECERAVRAADEMRSRLRIAQGVANGPVTVSGANPQVLGACVQDALELAQRAASGEVLLSDTVMHSARGMFEALQLDGGAGLRLSGILPASQPSHVTFVGRGRELALLGGMLALCGETGAGQNFLIRGDAGIGKSSLVAEFMTRARDAGYACLIAHVPGFGAGRRDHAAAKLLRALLGADQAGEHDLASLLDAEQGLDARQRALARDLLDLEKPPADRQLIAGMDDATRLSARRGLYLRLLETRAREQARVLLVEDIHWADSETLDILAALASSVAELPAIMLMTTRFDGEALNPAWRGGMRGAPLTTLDLGPLREEEALHVALGRVADESLATRYVARAEGNPLFLEQLIEYGKAGDKGETGDGGVPGSIQALIWSRLDRLDEGRQDAAQKHALQCAAVLGASFDGDALHALHEVDRAALDALLEQRLLRREGASYAFTHALIRECVYDSLLESRRKALHRRAAEWYAERDAALYAAHLDRAEDSEAAPAYARAAEALARDYHYAAALELAARGLEIAREAGAKLRLAVLRARLLLDSGDNQAALLAYARALESHAVDGDETVAARVDALLGHAAALASLDKHAAALAELDAARERMDRQASDTQRAHYHYLRGNSLFTLGETEACPRAHRQSLEYARKAASSRHQALALSGLADTWYQRGRMLSAHDAFDACIRLAREHAYSAIEISNLSMRALTSLYKLDIDAGLADIEQAIELNTDVGNRRGAALALNVKGMLLCHRGDWAPALRAGQQALAITRELGASLFSADNLSLIAYIEHAMGNGDMAQTHIGEAWNLVRDGGLSYCGPIVLATMALLHENEKRAWALAEGESLLGDKCIGHNHLHFFESAMQVALRERNWERAKDYARKLRDYTQDEPLPWSEFYIARTRVLAAIGEGANDTHTMKELRNLIDQARAQGSRAALAELESARETGDGY